MKKYVVLSLMSIVIILFMFTCKKKVDISKLHETNKVTYQINSKKPFTGIGVLFYKNGHKKEERKFINGLKEGKLHGWYENGKKYYENDYKQGKLNGKVLQWYKNGQLESEINVKDGKQHGKATMWYKNGKKRGEINYNNGVQINIQLFKKK